MVTDQRETYGWQEFVFDDFLPAVMEFRRTGSNPNQQLSTEAQNRAYAFHPEPVRTDDPNAQLLYGFRLTGTQWAGLAVAAGLTIYLIAK